MNSEEDYDPEVDQILSRYENHGQALDLIIINYLNDLDREQVPPPQDRDSDSDLTIVYSPEVQVKSVSRPLLFFNLLKLKFNLIKSKNNIYMFLVIL